MKNAWKWILGIVLILVLLSIPVVVYFVSGNHLVRGFNVHAPMMDRYAWGHHDFGRDLRGPMGLRGGFGFFSPFRLLGGLVRWAFFGALLYGAYWLGRRNAHVVLEPRPVVATPPPASSPTTQDGDNIANSE